MKSYAAYREFGVCAWWVWNGVMRKPFMLKQLDALKAAGIDEFCLYCEQGCSLDFLEKSWFDMVEWVIPEVKRRNMKMWIYDDLNWPSGTANGLMVREHPEFRSQSYQVRLLKVPAGSPFFYNESCQTERVFIRKPGEDDWTIIQLDDNHWVNDTGVEVELMYAAIRFYNKAMMTSCDANNSKGYRGYCDLLNPDAVKCWMGYIHDQYYKRFKKEFGKTIRGFFYDEPFTFHYAYVFGYEYLPWTPGLPERFLGKYGYDFRDWIPVLLYESKNPKAEQVRQDFWNLIEDISCHAFAETVANWCARHNVLSAGHCVGEEVTGQQFYNLFTGNIHRHLMFHQVPGMDLLSDNNPYHLDNTAHWYGTAPGTERIFNFTAKQCCSTARYSGAKRVIAEAMGVNIPNIAFDGEKLIWDWLAGCGVSILLENSMPYSFNGYKQNALGNKSWWQPWFKHYGIFSEYIRTMSQFATQPLQAETAVLFPNDTLHACTPVALPVPNCVPAKLTEDGILAEPIMATMDALLKNHIDFEMLFEDIVADAKVSRKGTLDAPHSAFRTIIVPQCPFLDPDIARKLKAFEDAGGRLIFVNCRPTRGAKPRKPLPNFSRTPLLVAKDKDFAKKLTKDIERKYRLVGEGVNEVFAALRGNQLVLSNQNREGKTITFKLETDLPRPIKASTPGEQGEWNMDPKTIILAPYQSLLLTFGEKATGKPPVTYNFVESGRPIDPKEWDYELSQPNNAMPCFELGLCPNREAYKDIKCWIPVSRDLRHGLTFSPEECPECWARAKFEAQYVPEKMAVVVDTTYYDKVVINGKEVTRTTSYGLWDHANRKFDISGLVKKGMNEIRVHIITDKWMEPRMANFHDGDSICPIVLHGYFGVKYKDRDTILTAMPKSLKLGDIPAQGFPQFLGDVTIKTKVRGEGSAISISNPAATATTVKVNGRNLGTRIWGPYVYDCSKVWRKGAENTVEITLCGNLGLLLRRRYGCAKFLPKPYGLLHAPVLN